MVCEANDTVGFIILTSELVQLWSTVTWLCLFLVSLPMVPQFQALSVSISWRVFTFQKYDTKTWLQYFKFTLKRINRAAYWVSLFQKNWRASDSVKLGQETDHLSIWIGNLYCSRVWRNQYSSSLSTGDLPS